MRLSNEQYIIKNIECNFYAFSGSRSSKGNTVDGKVRTQYWRIQETREKGKFTFVARHSINPSSFSYIQSRISTTDTDVFWSLSDAEANTPVRDFIWGHMTTLLLTLQAYFLDRSNSPRSQLTSAAGGFFAKLHQLRPSTLSRHRRTRATRKFKKYLMALANVQALRSYPDAIIFKR